MAKKALLTYGNPHSWENEPFFSKRLQENVQRMKEIFIKQGYSPLVISLEELFNKPWEEFSYYSAFYYTGHGNRKQIGTNNQIDLDDLFSSFSNFQERKLAIMDCCLEDYSLPKKFNLKVFHTRYGTYLHKNFSKLLYRFIVYNKKNFDEIKEDTLKNLGYSWAKCSIN